MSDLGRILITIGVLLVVLGVVVMVLGRFNVPLGRLPGDFSWKGQNWRVSFPLASSIVLSLALTLILWLISYFRR